MIMVSAGIGGLVTQGRDGFAALAREAHRPERGALSRSEISKWQDGNSTVALTVTTDQADYAPGSTATLTEIDITVADTLEFSVAPINASADADNFLAYNLSGTTTPWIVTDGAPGRRLDGTANGTIVTSWDVGSAASPCEQAFSHELLLPLTRDTALAAVPWLRSSPKARH
jgi:hypothetical protein